MAGADDNRRNVFDGSAPVGPLAPAPLGD